MLTHFYVPFVKFCFGKSAINLYILVHISAVSKTKTASNNKLGLGPFETVSPSLSMVEHYKVNAHTLYTDLLCILFTIIQEKQTKWMNDFPFFVVFEMY